MVGYRASTAEAGRRASIRAGCQLRQEHDQVPAHHLILPPALRAAARSRTPRGGDAGAPAIGAHHRRQVGRIALNAGIAVTQLVTETDNLEELFFSLTETGAHAGPDPAAAVGTEPGLTAEVAR